MYRFTALREFIQIAYVLTCVSSLLAVSTDGFSCTQLSGSLGSYGNIILMMFTIAWPRFLFRPKPLARNEKIETMSVIVSMAFLGLLSLLRVNAYINQLTITPIGRIVVWMLVGVMLLSTIGVVSGVWIVAGRNQR